MGWVQGFGHSPVCQILLQIVTRAVITSSPPAWTSFARKLSNPSDLLSSMIVLQPPPLCKGWGCCPLYLSADSLVLMNIQGPYDRTAQSSILSIISVTLRFSVKHSPKQSWIVVAFPCLILSRRTCCRVSFRPWRGLHAANNRCRRSYFDTFQFYFTSSWRMVGV